MEQREDRERVRREKRERDSRELRQLEKDIITAIQLLQGSALLLQRHEFPNLRFHCSSLVFEVQYLEVTFS